MNFSVFIPPAATNRVVPALYFLAGLTCTEETFMIKAGAQRLAAELGIMLVACDTSPRGLDLPGDSEHWDFGVGAGFYIDATHEPWAGNYRMGSYVDSELPSVIETNFPASTDRRGIFGHSMGGHGALVMALRRPIRWTSVSAFSPISNPSVVPWGQKAFTNYLGADKADWVEWDASELIREYPRSDVILIDQGSADPFLHRELQPEALEQAANCSGQKLKLRIHNGYDHSYWFIQTFMAEHLHFHARSLT
jgi:S-formylglutathione hydrolase